MWLFNKPIKASKNLEGRKQQIETARGRDIITPLAGLPYNMIGPSTDISVMKDTFLYTCWEPHVTKIVSSILKPGDTFIDVGANLGYYILLGSYLVGSSGHVFSFEPISINYKYCMKNIKLNNLRNVKLYECGLWHERAHKTMVVPPALLGNCQIKLDANEGNIDVELMPLDELNLEHIKLIKIDIEGAEPYALKGMKATIKRCRPKIVIEMNRLAMKNFGLDADVYWDFFQNESYSLKVILADARLQKVGSLESLKSTCAPDFYCDLLAEPL